MSVTDQNMHDMETPDTDNKVADWPSPGQKLKKIREEYGLSHARVAEALHMTAHYVKALENDQYEKLPGKTFVKGYFKAYARLLNADIDEILSCYEKYVAALEESEESEANEIRARKAYDQNLRWLICAAVIIVVVVGLSWWFARGDGSSASTLAGNKDEIIAEAPVSEEATVTAEVLVANLDRQQTEPAVRGGQTREVTHEDVTDNVPAVPASITSGENSARKTFTTEIADAGAVDSENSTAPADVDDRAAPLTALAEENPKPELPEYTVTRFSDHRLVRLESEGDDLLEVHFSGSSWIQIDNSENTRLYHDLLDLGDALTIRGKAPFNILIGDANVVDITFNSEEVDLITSIRSDNSARVLLKPGVH